MELEILSQTSGYNVSDKYNVIPTIEVMQEFERFGFQLDTIEAAGVRSMEKALKQKHMIRMSAEEKMFGGELKPQVVIYNSYDGTAALNINVGIFRFVCSNGMIAGHNLIQPMKIVHSNTGWKDLVHEYIDTYSEKYTAQKEQIQMMKDTRMTLDEAYDMAVQALEFRHYDQRIINDPVDPLELLIAKRREDRGDSAWLRLNVLQESLINGMYHKYGNDGSVRKAKILTNIDEIIRVNVELSDLFGGLYE
jgi:hypothetical protein